MCFNPCFNGSNTYTDIEDLPDEAIDQCFNPCFNGSNTYTWFSVCFCNNFYLVSILVLMDLILIPFICPLLHTSTILSFNPCFNGSNTYTINFYFCYYV